MRKLELVLTVSLLLNVFLAGGIAGGVFWYRFHGGRFVASSFRLPGSELPADEQKAFRMALREAREKARAAGADPRPSLEEAARLLEAPTLDEGALTKALGQARSAEFAIRDAVETRIVALAAAMSPADRARLGNRLHERAEVARR